MSDAPEPLPSPSRPERAAPLPASLEPGRRPLAIAQIRVGRIVGWIVASVPLVGSLATFVNGWVFDWFPLWLDVLVGVAWFGLLTGLGWLAHVWPVKEHRHAAWQISDDGLAVWKGVVWRRAIRVPRSRVQHTDVLQGPLQRRYGLATLSVHTAGTEHAKVELEGLLHADAIAARDRLAPRGEADGV